MYGFVNQALQDFVLRESTFDTWEEILYVLKTDFVCINFCISFETIKRCIRAKRTTVLMSICQEFRLNTIDFP